jgi:Xaa-Pro aminopeptidase
VVLGEPSRELQACMAALRTGSELVLEKARPGMKYSELSRLVGAAMKQAYTGGLTIRFGAGHTRSGCSTPTSRIAMACQSSCRKT